MLGWIADRLRACASPRMLAALRRNQAGAAVVEFAFVFPIFLLFVCGIIEFGRAIWTNYFLQSVAEDTSRYVLAHPTLTDTQIADVARNGLSFVDPSTVTVTVTRETASGVNFLSVSLGYSFRILTNVAPVGTIPLIGRSRVPLTAPP